MSDFEGDTAALAAEVIGRAGGRILVIGAVPSGLLDALAVTATELVCSGDDATFERAKKLARDHGAAPVRRVDLARGRGAPKGDFSGLVVCDTEMGVDAPAFFDRLIGPITDGGTVVIDVALAPIDERRVRKLIEASCREIAAVLPDVRGRLRLTALRDAPGRDATGDDYPEPRDAVIVIVGTEDAPSVTDVTIDALIRQTTPPAVVVVVDDGVGEKEPIPDDLWGLAAMSMSQPALLRTEGEGFLAAADAAIEAVEQSQILVTMGGMRLSPRAIEILGAALDREPKWPAVCGTILVADDRVRGVERASLGAECDVFDLRHLLSGASEPLGAMLIRRRALERIGWNPKHTGLESLMDLAFRFAEKTTIGRVPLPVALAVDGAAEVSAARREVLLDHRARFDGVALARRLDLAGRRGRATSLSYRARYLAEAGAVDEALEDLETASRLAPEDAEIVIRRAAVLCRAGRTKESLALLDGEAGRFADGIFESARSKVLAVMDGAAESAMRTTNSGGGRLDPTASALLDL